MFLQSVTIYLVLSLSGHFDWSFTITTSTTVRHQQLIFQHESSEKEEEGKKNMMKKSLLNDRVNGVGGNE